ncbi:MAG: hypothetical protein AB2L09_12450 [Coriobacteriia bacterium]
MPDDTENIEAIDEAPFGVRLEHPSIEDVRHYTRNFGWEGRFEFIEPVPSLGAIIQRSYGIEHFIGTIAQQQFESGNSSGNVFFIDLDKLIAWIRDVVGDISFAKALKNAVDPKDSNYSQLDTIRAIGTNRLNQYFEVLEEAECSGEDSMIPAQNREGE